MTWALRAMKGACSPLLSPAPAPVCDEVKGFCLVLRLNHYTIELSLISVVKLRVEEILKIAIEVTVDGVE